MKLGGMVFRQFLPVQVVKELVAEALIAFALGHDFRSTSGLGGKNLHVVRFAPLALGTAARRSAGIDRPRPLIVITMGFASGRLTGFSSKHPPA
jgi:hypothetical protein